MQICYKLIVNASVAQSVEQRTENPCVNSSILFGGMIKTISNDGLFFMILVQFI